MGCGNRGFLLGCLWQAPGDHQEPQLTPMVPSSRPRRSLASPGGPVHLKSWVFSPCHPSPPEKALSGGQRNKDASPETLNMPGALCGFRGLCQAKPRDAAWHSASALTSQGVLRRTVAFCSTTVQAELAAHRKGFFSPCPPPTRPTLERCRVVGAPLFFCLGWFHEMR